MACLFIFSIGSARANACTIERVATTELLEDRSHFLAPVTFNENSQIQFLVVGWHGVGEATSRSGLAALLDCAPLRSGARRKQPRPRMAHLRCAIEHLNTNQRSHFGMKKSTLTKTGHVLLLWMAMVPASFATSAFDALRGPEPALPNERVIYIPGDTSVEPARLQVTVATPDGPGPFPLAVVNHGATWDVPPSEQPRVHLGYAATYFLSRGYAVALPMMRGYAGSGGRQINPTCDLAARGIASARDIRAIIDYMREQPYVDGSRIIATGQSMGGWNALAVGALKMPDVKGLVSFAGGVRVKGCNNADERLISAAGELGRQSTVPSLWLFGDNDSILPTSTWRAMHQHYVAAGGDAELVSYGPFRSDSHELLSSWEGLSVWVPRLDAFLARIGMPSASTYPENMPMPVPPASGYAKIDDVDALPYLNTENGKMFYRKFLEKPVPRVFAIGDGAAADAYETFDPLAAALRRCETGGKGRNCRLYAVDNDVVWTRPTPAPPPTNFAALANQNAVPYLGAKGRAGYEKFLAAPRPRAFVIAPDGTSSIAVLGPDPIATAMEGCRKTHRNCRLYAVDGDVVW